MKYQQNFSFSAGIAVLVVSALSLNASAAAEEPQTESAKIDRLIADVRQLKDADFIRNGKSYDGSAAADHIQAKYDHVKDQIKTAREFIEKCASKSEKSGEAYKIRFKDGTEKTASEYLNSKLDEIEKSAK